MSSEITALAVRQYAREQADNRVEFEIAESFRGQVRFSPTADAVTRSCADGRLLDMSAGGIGVVLRQFVPRMCEGVIRVMRFDGEIIFEHAAKVQRVNLNDRTPEYQVGLSFIQPEEDLEARVTALLASLRDRQEGQV